MVTRQKVDLLATMSNNDTHGVIITCNDTATLISQYADDAFLILDGTKSPLQMKHSNV